MFAVRVLQAAGQEGISELDQHRWTHRSAGKPLGGPQAPAPLEQQQEKFPWCKQ